jgi:CRISPR-associated protein Csb1
MAENLSLDELSAAVAGTAAAFRSITKLQPVGGEGDKVFPATYSGGAYATERRTLDGTIVDCVLIDSVQSQANRAEEALKFATERGRTKLPLIEISFQEANKEILRPLPNLTSLDVPHRLADAILRDSVLPDGTLFSKSEYAQRWGRSNLWNATAVYELCPTALLFGMWGSPEKPGGLGAKFERAFVSEIVAVDVVSNAPPDKTSDDIWAYRTVSGKRVGFRIDPLSASSYVEVKKAEDDSLDVQPIKWDKDGNPVKAPEKTRPSNINHGNILFGPKKDAAANGGIRFRYAEQTTVVSLGALRKLRFPIDGNDTPEWNDAGRTVLAALGLCAGVLAAEANTSLRSRCQLWPVAEREWELVDKPGQAPRRFRMNSDHALTLLNEAVSAARQAGLPWLEEKIVLRPSVGLIQLIQKSQEAAAKEKGEGDAE